MNKKDAIDMTKDPINQVILTIATPLMINNLIRTLYNLTDGLFVAQLSAEDFAATAFIWPLNFLFISLGLGLSVGSTSLIARFLGAEKIEKAQTYANQAMLLTYSLGIVLSLIGYIFAPNFVQWMGASGTFADKSTVYLKINFIGLFFDFAYFGYQSILNAQGETKIITKISALSAIANIILDPIFIFAQVPLIGIAGLGWGIEGAGWATVISKALLLFFAILAVRRQSVLRAPFKKLTVQVRVMKDILRIALPSAVGYGGAALGFTVLNGLIQSYGTQTLAAYSMVNRISDLLTQPQMGIGSALTAIVAQNMGARQVERSKQIFRQAMFLILGISLLGSVTIFLFRQPILSLFITDMSDQVLWSEAVEYLNYTAFIIFFMGMFSALTGFFQGCGETRYSMLMSIGRLWLVRLPIIWLLSHYTDLGSTGIWIAMLLSNAITVILGYGIYKLKDWKQLQIR
ncbi:MATE family efflux transporter [Granulicatella seriolae]|uniref:Probable multidrug resistance protein NorM n=1 Tax=Granulicatella seriolae TaxID=2967226 RepID=A0ABT1WPB6_9LACT|nr:MATE family efflux transporter [Granulicatella seriolae]